MAGPAIGIIASIDLLRVSLADCETFQTWCGAADATGALDRIHKFAPPKHADNMGPFTWAELQALMPYAVVTLDEDEGGFTATNSSDGGYTPGGILIAGLAEHVPAEIAHDPAQVTGDFLTTVDLILGELRAQATVGARLDPQSWGIASGPHRCDPEDVETQGDWQGITLSFPWGLSP